jgi:hypothetical protein
MLIICVEDDFILIISNNNNNNNNKKKKKKNRNKNKNKNKNKKKKKKKKKNILYIRDNFTPFERYTDFSTFERQFYSH